MALNTLSPKIAFDTEHKNSSTFVDDQLITPLKKEYGGDLSEFLEEYYRWMEEENNIKFDISNILEYKKLDNPDNKFNDLIDEEILKLFPNTAKINRELLRKNISSFYETRGSNKSYKFLFKALYDKEIEILYPGENILIPSWGDWTSKTIIRTSSFTQNISSILPNRQIRGLSSSATAFVENVVILTYGSITFADLTLSNIVGIFENNEIIETLSNSDTLNPIIERIFPIIINTEIISGGSGYVENELLNFSGGSGSGLIIKISSVDELGSILTLDIEDPGIGYSTLPTILSFGSGTGANISIVGGGQYTDSGHYGTEKSRVSHDSKIRDGGIYQEFAYIIESDITIEEFRKPVLDLLHPAGVNMVSRFRSYVDSLESDNLLFHTNDINDIYESCQNRKTPNEIESVCNILTRRFFHLLIIINIDGFSTLENYEKLKLGSLLSDDGLFTSLTRNLQIKYKDSYFRNILSAIFYSDIGTSVEYVESLTQEEIIQSGLLIHLINDNNVVEKREFLMKNVFNKFPLENMILINEMTFNPSNYKTLFKTFSKRIDVSPSESFLRTL